MGANFNTMIYPGTLSTQELKQHFQIDQTQDRYENGNSYSGGIGMATGLHICLDKKFGTEREAYDYLSDKAEKWGPAIAVKFDNVVSKPAIQLTVGGKPASWQNPCVSINKHSLLCIRHAQGPNNLVCVDQVNSAKVAASLIRRAKKMCKLRDDLLAAERRLNQVLMEWKVLRIEPSTPVKAIPKLRTAAKNAAEKLSLAEDDLLAYAKPIDERLSVTVDDNRGEMWLVGAVCAS